MYLKQFLTDVLLLHEQFFYALQREHLTLSRLNDRLMGFNLVGDDRANYAQNLAKVIVQLPDLLDRNLVNYNDTVMCGGPAVSPLKTVLPDNNISILA